jgi:endonuclease/exonuclease/phosphatase family metal-dependent hydrolase
MPQAGVSGSGRLRLRVMSFNVRFDTEQDAPDHTWRRRKKAAAELIGRCGPQVVGIQEALAHQLGDLLEALPGYHHVGRAREAGGRGEFVPILFERRQLEVVEAGDFWLSQTPDTEGSLGWDAPNPRICTWAVLRDLTGGGSFLVLNAHLDRWGEQARAESATMLVDKMGEFPTLPCIVTADLNSGEGDRPLSILEAAMLRDSYRDLFDGPVVGTVHHYGEPAGAKIDFVLCDPSWRVLSAAVIQDRPFGRWPSDHFPVMADLELIGHPATEHRPLL